MWNVKCQSPQLADRLLQNKITWLIDLHRSNRFKFVTPVDIGLGLGQECKNIRFWDDQNLNLKFPAEHPIRHENIHFTLIKINIAYITCILLQLAAIVELSFNDRKGFLPWSTIKMLVWYYGNCKIIIFTYQLLYFIIFGRWCTSELFKTSNCNKKYCFQTYFVPQNNKRKNFCLTNKLQNAKRMHSSRMRTARSLTVSHRKNHTCPPGSNHACPPWSNHAHPPRSNHACPPWSNHACPPEQPCTPPGATMNAPQSNHPCPPAATMHAPPEQPHMPPLWTEWQTPVKT